MMCDGIRNREWRRWRSDLVFKRRLKRFSRSYTTLTLDDGRYIMNPIWCDFISVKYFHIYKSISTTKYDTRNKIKYTDSRYSWKEINTRLSDKRTFLNLKSEYYEST